MQATSIEMNTARTLRRARAWGTALRMHEASCRATGWGTAAFVGWLAVVGVGPVLGSVVIGIGLDRLEWAKLYVFLQALAFSATAVASLNAARWTQQAYRGPCDVGFTFAILSMAFAAILGGFFLWYVWVLSTWRVAG